MAKIKSPLLSMGGTGTIGKSVVFSSWRGQPYARQHVTPANPQTTAQQLTRTTFAMLREMWKLAPSLARKPWEAFATGKRFIGLNAFIGDNVRVLRGETDMANFIGSPGARGGLPAESINATAGAASGEIDVAFTNPTPPDGWTLESVIAMAFPDQDPAVGFGGPLVAEEDDTTQSQVTLSGLTPDTLCVVAAWLRWTKPDGTVAYSVGITATVTSAA